MVRFEDWGDWYTVWMHDRLAKAEMLRGNLLSIRSEYSIYASYPWEAREVIETVARKVCSDFAVQLEAQMVTLRSMDSAQRNRWCFDDLMARAAEALKNES